jgi:modulator of FtsH protease
MTLDAWSDFFVAAAGASAALAGLIIVAMSVSIDTVIAIPSMPSRAGTASGLLVAATVISLAGLIPDQGALAFGIETAVIGAAALALAVDSLVRVVRDRGERSVASAWARSLVSVVPAALFVIGGVIIATGGPGEFVVAAGMMLGVVAAVLIAWVILVELKR